MTGRVLDDCFVHEHNRREVARQEYEAAKRNFLEVCKSYIAGVAVHNRRVRDAMERPEAAREACLRAIGAG